jgi:hypothetical protein
LSVPATSSQISNRVISGPLQVPPLYEYPVEQKYSHFVPKVHELTSVLFTSSPVIPVSSPKHRLEFGAGGLEPVQEYVIALNVALIVCPDVTLGKVYELTAPTLPPSTTTFPMVYPLLGVMVKVWLLPWITGMLPEGLMVPPEPDDAEMVYVGRAAGFTVTVTLLCPLGTPAFQHSSV